MHGGPRFDRGSKKRISRIRVRGNWPSWGLFVQMLLTLVGIVAILFMHSWMERTGRIE